MIGYLRQRFLARLSADHKAGVKGVGWTTLSQGCVLAVRLGSTLILTRLLAPEVYGVFGTAMGLLVVLDWLSDLGITPALRRHAEGGTDRFLNTGWVMGLARGSVLSVAVLLIAPLMAGYHQEPILWPVLSVLGLRAMIYGFLSPGTPLLYREMNYRSLFILEFGQTLIGTSVTILLAWQWRPSIWAIVLGILAGELAQVTLSYILYPRRPRLQPDREAARAIRSFGTQVLLNTLVFALWVNFERIFGLRLIGDVAMGHYVLAITLAAVIEMLIARVCDVYFGVLTREPDDENRQRWHRKMCRNVARFGMPLLALGAVLAPLAVRLLYDPRYEPAGVLFALLLVRQMIRTLGHVQFQYLMARGDVYLATRCYLLALAVQAVIFWPLTSHFGATGMALSVVISVTFYGVTQTWQMSRRGQASWGPMVETLLWAAGTGTAVFMIYHSR